MTDPQHAGLLRRVIAVVSPIAADEVFDQAGEGVGFKLVVGDKQGRSRQ